MVRRVTLSAFVHKRGQKRSGGETYLEIALRKTIARRETRSVHSSQATWVSWFLYHPNPFLPTPGYCGDYPFDGWARRCLSIMFRANSSSYFMMPFRKPVHGLRRIILLLMIPLTVLTLRYYMPGRTEWMSNAVRTQAERLQSETSHYEGQYSFSLMSLASTRYWYLIRWVGYREIQDTIGETRRKFLGWWRWPVHG